MKAGADAPRGGLLFSTAIIRGAAMGRPADISAADSRRRLHTLEPSDGTEGKSHKRNGFGTFASPPRMPDISFFSENTVFVKPY